jgi:hypothetical protein
MILEKTSGLSFKEEVTIKIKGYKKSSPIIVMGK